MGKQSLAPSSHRLIVLLPPVFASEFSPTNNTAARVLAGDLVARTRGTVVDRAHLARDNIA